MATNNNTDTFAQEKVKLIKTKGSEKRKNDQNNGKGVKKPNPIKERKLKD